MKTRPKTTLPYHYYLVGDGRGRYLSYHSQGGTFKKVRTTNREEDAMPYFTREIAEMVASTMGWVVIEREAYE